MADRQRGDHAQEAIDVKVINDQEEADVDIQHAEFLAATVFANAYAEKIESKLRTVSFLLVEDYMANTSSICTLDHEDIQDVGLIHVKLVSLAKLKLVIKFTSSGVSRELEIKKLLFGQLIRQV